MIKTLLIAALMAGAATPAFAQTAKPDADPAMWVVKDADTTIYLFGTFHLLDGKRDWFNDGVKTAFDASDEVVLEAIMPKDPAAIAPLMQKYAMDPSGATLESKLTPAVKAKFAAAKVPTNAFGAMEPWFASIMLTGVGAQKLGLTPEHGPEAVITTAAEARKIPIGELEGMDLQLSLFDTMPEAKQMKFLGQTLDGMADLEKTFTPMLTAWSNGDVDGLATIMNEGVEDDQELYDLIFTDRNAKWAEWIDARMDKPGTVFVAVGAGHLAGKGSVQSFLATRGFESSRVTD
ncbi:MAG: TraB/GumN family protein [Pseudomonadota bacterium]|nr:TraB/GumN family protein [Pseudomonadota bacterium]